MLHLISQITVDDSILQRIAADDVVVILDGAVLRTLYKSNKAIALTDLLRYSRCCVLNEHLLRYGILEEEIINGIEIIDYVTLVNLTLTHPLIQTWN
ncbi:MAG: DsrH/TusB family sulfur metabolism protein [Methylococcales bacterium]